MATNIEGIIRKLPEQFQFEPVIENGSKLPDSDTFSHIIAGGMGGSHLAPDLANITNPESRIIVHKDYGLPDLEEQTLENSFFIAISYSGNTEETLSFADEVYKKGFKLACISTGGKLIDFAKKESLPYVEVPETGIPPRMATGLMLVSLLALLDKKETLEMLKKYSLEINTDEQKEEAEKIADFVGDGVPIIYSSEKNGALAYYMKILLNESSKVPAFSNTFPELNHNAMQGFSSEDGLKEKFILIRDENDNPHIKRRMDVFKESLGEKGAEIFETSAFFDEERCKKVLNFMMLSHWLSFAVAEKRGVDMINTSLIEDFKKRL